MPESGNPFRLGYAFREKKAESFMVPSFVNLAADRGIRFIPIDTSKPLTQQGPFDCIIHKLYGEDWKRSLDDFSLQNTSAVIIDPPAAIEKLHNRTTMLQVVTQLEIPHLNIPKQLLILDSSSFPDLTTEINELKFPVIAKPVVADGSSKSHEMSLVFNSEGLKGMNLEIQAPIVLQEFVNHGGIIFKVYVAGEYVKCVKRKSLPDITTAFSSEETGGILPFSQISNSAVLEPEEVEMPELDFVAEIANGLRKALGLRLFNFDMIRNGKNNEYLVIDINYFPGFEKLPSYETVMTDFFLDIMQAQKNQDELFGGEECCGKK